MKKSNYLFTRIFVLIFAVIGLILAVFPGMYLKTNAYMLGENKVFFETFIPTYTAIFGGNFNTNLLINKASEAFKDNPEIVKILEENITLTIKTNILVSIFFVLSLVCIVVFTFNAKSRIVSLVTSIILITTTITIATSNLTFNYSGGSEFVTFISEPEISLGTMFLILCFATMSAILLFHLFRILIKPNSLTPELDQNLQD